MTLLIILVLISSLSFIYYGFTAITAKSMEAEFTRYGLDKYRILVGYLQLLGGIGLLVGLKIPLILTVSAGGLSLLMLMGFLVRIKMKDSFLLSLPSFLFMILNCYIFLLALRLVNLPK